MTSKRRKSAKTNKLEAFLCPYKFVQQSNQLAHKMRSQNQRKTDALGCEFFSKFCTIIMFQISIDNKQLIYLLGRYVLDYSGTYFVIIENN